MNFVYPAVFHRVNGCYEVEFPDLPGCISNGTDFRESVRNAQDALERYLIKNLTRTLCVNAPTDISGIPAPEDGFVNHISCNLNPNKVTAIV